jgi:hypothetical protein
MSATFLAVVRDGKIEPTPSVDLPEGAPLLVTMLADDDSEFWQKISDRSLASIWDNSADDVYAQLLQE